MANDASTDIKVIGPKGEIKYFSKHMVENTNVMKRHGYKLFKAEAPEFEPGKEPAKEPINVNQKPK